MVVSFGDWTTGGNNEAKMKLLIKICLFIQFLMPEKPKTVKILNSNVYIWERVKTP